MSDPLITRTGGAMMWRGVHHGSIRIVSLLQMLVLAKILRPSDFGTWSVAAVTVWSIQQISDFGLIPALVQRTQPAARHYHSAWTLRVLRGAVIGLVVTATSAWIADLFEQPAAAPLLAVLGWRPFAESFSSVRVADLTRELRFRALAAVHVPAIALEAIVSIVLAPPLGAWAFVVGALTGTAVMVVLSYWAAPYQPKLNFDRATALSLIRFGRWIFLSGVAGVVGNYALRVAISRELGATALGIYFLAAKLAFLPGDAAAKLAGEVSFPLFAHLRDDREKLTRVWNAILSGVLFFLIPVFAMIIALAPAIPIFLGEKWAAAVPVARLLAVAGLLGLFGDTVVPVLKGCGEPNKVTILEAIQSAVVAGLAFILVGDWGLTGAALAWLPAMAATFCLNNAFAKRLMPKYRGGLARLAIAIGFSAIVAGVLAWATHQATPGKLGPVAGLLIGGVAYAILMLLMNRLTRLNLWSRVSILWSE